MKTSYIEKLEAFERRYRETGAMLGTAEVVGDSRRLRELSREHNWLGRGVELLERYRRVLGEIESARQLAGGGEDAAMRELAAEELASLEAEQASIEEDVRFFLIPPDPNSGRTMILEIRAGTGGDESALFAADMLRMYLRFAERRGVKSEILAENPTELGGYKEVFMALSGKDAYDLFRYEMGTHRVQRVPETESSGRIHTSAVTVAVMPEAEETELVIDDKDLRIDVFRSSGPGGQSVNTTDSAVRITHLPTGLVVSCQDEKSQHKNKAKAMTVLRSRLLDRMEQEQHSKQAAERRSQVGSGDRSGRIRTYNFSENRVTDHRIGLTLYKLTAVMGGDLDELAEALDRARREEALSELVKE
jgi:peptide chain release factor 1